MLDFGILLAFSLCLFGSTGASADNLQTDTKASRNTIANYSPLVTGNGFGYAVVDKAGTVVRFYAHPYRFERPNIDVTKDGSTTANLVKKLAWKDSISSKHAPLLSYLSESQIVSAKTAADEHVFFMPFALKHNALIAINRSHNRQRNSVAAVLQLVFEDAPTKTCTKNVDGHLVHIFSFQNAKELLAVVPMIMQSSFDEKRKSNQGQNQPCSSKTSVTVPAGKSTLEFSGPSFALIVLEKPEEADIAVKHLTSWQNGLSDNALLERELRTLDAWRKKPLVAFASEQEHHLWRQSETILRMAQIEEENRESRVNHGLILASLPDGIWFTAWVRDMSYALVGLAHMGHFAEAREGILAWFNARPVGRWKQDTRGLDYQISVTRYFGDGSEESDYSGQKSENCEFDDWGLALWAVSEYWERTHDRSLLEEKTYRGTVYEAMRDFVVKPLLGNLDACGDGLIVAQDSSCWEEHQENKRHYACSTIAAIPGLRGFLNIAQSMQDQETVKLVSEKLLLLDKGFKNAFVKDGWVKGVLEVDTQPKSEVDGAVLEAFNLNIINDPAVIEKTLNKMQLLKTASGGYRRNQGAGNYEAHEFLLIDFNLARVYFKLGRPVEASRILQTLVSKSCQDHGLIPEMYVSAKGRDYQGEIGDPTGAIPMVGFGAGDYVITLTDRAKYQQPGR